MIISTYLSHCASGHMIYFRYLFTRDYDVRPHFFCKAEKDSLRDQSLNPQTRASPGISLDIAFASLSHQLEGAEGVLLILQADNEKNNERFCSIENCWGVKFVPLSDSRFGTKLSLCS